MKYDKKWVELLAEQLVVDVADWMTGLHFVCKHQDQPQSFGQNLHEVCAQAKGDIQIVMQFWAEPQFFHGIAFKICGGEPQDDEEIQECAIEFMNVLCGRFISAICSDMKIKLFFSTPDYRVPPSVDLLREEEESSVLNFCNEEYGEVIFRWVVEMP